MKEEKNIGETNKSFGYKLGQIFAAAVCASATAIIIAVTVRIILWILL